MGILSWSPYIASILAIILLCSLAHCASTGVAGNLVKSMKHYLVHMVIKKIFTEEALMWIFTWNINNIIFSGPFLEVYHMCFIKPTYHQCSSRIFLNPWISSHTISLSVNWYRSMIHSHLSFHTKWKINYPFNFCPLKGFFFLVLQVPHPLWGHTAAAGHVCNANQKWAILPQLTSYTEPTWRHGGR